MSYGIPGVKAVLDGYGYFGGTCRLPLLDMNEVEVQDIKSTFEKNGFQWPDLKKIDSERSKSN